MSLFIDNYRCIVYNNKHKDDVEVMCRMGRKSVAVLPQTQAILEQLGEQIKLARLRRHLSAELVAERAGVSRATVWNVEKGNPSNASRTTINKVSVSLLHTTVIVMRSKNLHLVSSQLNIIIHINILLLPIFRLVFTWQH